MPMKLGKKPDAAPPTWQEQARARYDAECDAMRKAATALLNGVNGMSQCMIRITERQADGSTVTRQLWQGLPLDDPAAEDREKWVVLYAKLKALLAEELDVVGVDDKP